MSSLTVLFLRQANLKRSGAMSLGALPSNQLQFQKEACLPSPSLTTILTLKSCLSISSHGVCDPTHGLSLSVQANHSHLRRKALPKQSKSKMLSPPSCFGKSSFLHLTKQCPLLASSEPFQRKDLN
jgi:hypothetical protein